MEGEGDGVTLANCVNGEREGGMGGKGGGRTYQTNDRVLCSFVNDNVRQAPFVLVTGSKLKEFQRDLVGEI